MGRRRAVRGPVAVAVARSRVRRVSGAGRLSDIYASDHAEQRLGGRFRWLMSTFLAASVGGVAIFIAVVGALDPSEGVPVLLPTILDGSSRGPARITSEVGLDWSLPRSDKLKIVTGAVSTRSIIQERVEVKRDNRPFMQLKPYLRVTARLTSVPLAEAALIPPFNPVELYNSPDTPEGGAGSGPGAPSAGEVTTQVLELFGDALAIDDHHDLDPAEVAALVQQAEEEEAQASQLRPGFAPEVAKPAPQQEARPRAGGGAATPAAASPFTTLLPKTVAARDTADLERREVRRIDVTRRDKLKSVLQALGSDPETAIEMQVAASSVLRDGDVMPGQTLRVTLEPSLVRQNSLEPTAISVYEGARHRITITTDGAGGFIASLTPPDRPATSTEDEAASSEATNSVYAGLYYAALKQGVSADTILRVLHVLAPGTDFRRRIQPTDQVDFLFDIPNSGDKGIDSTPGELLFMSVTIGGETQRFWRYRSPDGGVDYFDAAGNTSRKFLNRKPVRGGDEVRFTSGFGYRRHPVLGISRPHNGIDWAAVDGTPVMAAANGEIDKIGHSGEYGNRIILRHANGYMTTYNHMSRFASGITEGLKVRQNQVIGYVGHTGLVSGPHLHFEVLINGRFVDPLKIQVGTDRQLKGKQLSDFWRERLKIDDLLRRSPVETASR